MSMYRWLSRREHGFKKRYGDMNSVYRSIYSSLGNQCWRFPSPDRGAINALEFSLDGHYVIAGCQTQTVLIFDTRNSKREISCKVVHEQEVTALKYLDDHTFATGSDDMTVKLWDRRNMSDNLCVLQGHTSYVKGLDYHRESKTLLSSGLDGRMNAWDLHDLNETQRLRHQPIRIAGMIRCRLSADGHRLAVSTSFGFIVIINNLNLGHLQADFKDFKPNLYRTMTYCEPCAPITRKHRHMFKPKRNSIAIVDEIPKGAEIINSVEIHPKGWCTVSRCVNKDTQKVWTFVHDIRNHVFPHEIEDDPHQQADGEIDMKYDEGLEMMTFPNHLPNLRLGAFRNRLPLATVNNPAPNTRRFGEIFGQNRTRSVEENGENVAARLNPGEAQHVENDPGIPDIFINQHPLHHGAPRRPEQMVRSRIASGVTRVQTIRMGEVCVPSILGRNSSRSLFFISGKNDESSYVIDSCFTPDGRIICVPNHDDMRLLAFDADCSEPQYAASSTTRLLHVFRTIDSSIHAHNANRQILCCRFSPIQPLLVSGTCEGFVHFDCPF